MFDTVKSWLSSGPATRWFAEVEEPGYVQSARLDEAEYAKKKDHTHVLTLELEEPARDGNDVSHINLRTDANGAIVTQLDLLAGDSAASVNMNNVSEELLDAVAVKTDETVRDTSRIKIYEEVISTAE